MTATEPINYARSWKRLDGVDILRGLAIFFVLMNHVNIRLVLARVPYTTGIPELLVQTFVWNGQFGVQMFFAVSGFLITSTTIRRWGSAKAVSIRDFYKLRVARIVPLLLALLVILTLLHFGHVKDFVIPAKRGGYWRALLSVLTLRVNVQEARWGYLPGAWDILWSLSIEEMFYLFFPLVCRWIGRGKLLIAILTTFVVLGPFARIVFTRGNDIWREKSYLGGMDAIALGCLTALLVSRMQFSKRVLRTFLCIGATLLVLILVFASAVWMRAPDRAGLDETILAVGTCLVMIAAAQSQWRAPWLLRPLIQLGQNSYEIYLTHCFAVFAFFDLFLLMGKPMRLIPFLFVITIAIAALLGEVVARFYSEPMNRMLRERWADGPSQMGSAVEPAPEGKADPRLDKSALP